MENDKIEQFLKPYSSQNTINAYRRQLRKYFEIIKADPEKYIKNGRDYQKDIETYWNEYLKIKSPKTRTQALSAIKMFLEEYLDEEIYAKQLSRKFFKKLTRRAKGNKAQTKDKVPIPETLKIILQHTGLRGKALFLSLATSGMRVDEMLHITWKHVEMDKTPVQINIPANISKTGESRITFITDEAKGALKEWRKIRNDYLEMACKMAQEGTKDENDPRIFPFHYQSAWGMWNKAITKAKLATKDDNTNRYHYHIHVLRKFFRSRMGNKNGIGVDMTEFLMGHEGYLTREYRDYPDEELAKEYMKGAERLLIFETPADTSDIRESLAEKDQQIKELGEKYNSMRMDHIQMQIDLGKALEELKKLELKKR